MSRTERRALERKGLKEARRIEKQAGIHVTQAHPAAEPQPTPVPSSETTSNSITSARQPRSATPAQRSANQQNAQHSTGPRTSEGKSISSRNSSTHSLSGTGFKLLPNENQEEYNELEAGLTAEYQPATLTEILLVRKMAQSWWLRQRAQSYTDSAFPDTRTGESLLDMLPLFARYQAQHDRAFHKALNDLLKIRAERRREEVARDKAEKVEIVLAQRSEYNSLRTQILRLKIKNHTPSRKAATTPAPEIGFVSQCASDVFANPTGATEIYCSEGLG